jgi:hypothetical protein
MDISTALNPSKEAPQNVEQEEHTVEKPKFNPWNIRLPPMKLSPDEASPNSFSREPQMHPDEGYFSPPNYGSSSTPTTPGIPEITRLPSINMKWEAPSPQMLPKIEHDYKERVEAWNLQQLHVAKSSRLCEESSVSSVSLQMRVNQTNLQSHPTIYYDQQSIKTELRHCYPAPGYQIQPTKLTPAPNYQHLQLKSSGPEPSLIYPYQDQLVRLEQGNKKRFRLARLGRPPIFQQQSGEKRRHAPSTRRHSPPSSQRRISPYTLTERRDNDSWRVAAYHGPDCSCSLYMNPSPHQRDLHDIQCTIQNRNGRGKKPKPKGPHSNEAYSLEQGKSYSTVKQTPPCFSLSVEHSFRFPSLQLSSLRSSLFLG